jgi:hypothetical protein
MIGAAELGVRLIQFMKHLICTAILGATCLLPLDSFPAPKYSVFSGEYVIREQSFSLEESIELGNSINAKDFNYVNNGRFRVRGSGVVAGSFNLTLVRKGKVVDSVSLTTKGRIVGKAGAYKARLTIKLRSGETLTGTIRASKLRFVIPRASFYVAGSYKGFSLDIRSNHYD